MSEPIDRAARAILAKVPVGYGMRKDEAEMYVRAVVEALREPTAAMREAGLTAAVESRVDADDIGDATAVYQAMLDEVLK